MRTLREAAEEFLAQRRIAVAGVSRDEKQTANAIYRRLRDAGYEVVPVNPNADEVEGDPCYPTLAAIPERPDGVLVVTPPDAAPAVARQAVESGVPRLWMHRSFGAGSASEEATRICREAGIAVLDGACPMMFLDPVDPFHKCFRWFFDKTGKLPDGSTYDPPDGPPAGGPEAADRS